jgi:hypothetical protein
VAFPLLALGLAVLASGFLLVAPTYTGVRAAVVVPGGAANGAANGAPGEAPSAAVRRPSEVRRATLLEVNGPRVLPLLAITIALAALGVVVGQTLWLRAGRGLSALLLLAFMLLAFMLVTGFSIGLYYLPSALTMLAAAFARPGRQAA